MKQFSMSQYVLNCVLEHAEGVRVCIQ